MNAGSKPNVVFIVGDNVGWGCSVLRRPMGALAKSAAQYPSTKRPLLFRNELVPADGLDEQRAARPDEVKRLGEHPTVIRVRTGREPWR